MKNPERDVTSELAGAWVDIDIYVYCQVCGQAVKTEDWGSHKRKHPGQVVNYYWFPPEALGVSLEVGKPKDL